jgi:hypothetical protein
MVLFSQFAINNLSDILTGLISWKKHPLEVKHALKYVSDIRQVCDKLDIKAFHFNTRFTIHKRYGEKVHTYKRNKILYGILFTILTNMGMYIYKE